VNGLIERVTGSPTSTPPVRPPSVRAGTAISVAQESVEIVRRTLVEERLRT
jgi:hypothetical protein